MEQFAIGLRANPNDAELLSAMVISEQRLGRWDNALRLLKQAMVLDPRSPLVTQRMLRTLIWLRQGDEAIAQADRAIALEPDVVQFHQSKAMALLEKGDLAGAKAAIRAIPLTVDSTAAAAEIATGWDLFWLLDQPQITRLLRAPSAGLGADRFAAALLKAQMYAYLGDRRRARAYGDSAVRAAPARLSATLERPQDHALIGLANAYAGRKPAAIREGERGMSLLPISKDGYGGPYVQHQLVRIYVLTGEPQKAVELLAPLLDVPYFLTPGWLQVDPTLAPLRKLPRFQLLIAGAESAR